MFFTSEVLPLKRNSILRLITGLMVIFCLFGVAGCTNNSDVPSDPKDAIIDKYGNTQYKITFDATNLASPISDMYYAANNMPVLPTPEKVGYVFAGWYFDSALTQVCDVENGDLFWQMKNVTLYPKWEKEAIVNNGTYDIDFEAHIIEETVVKGILADKYGWFNFAEDIVADETYIEKNDQGAFLRIQYNSRERGPIFAENGGGEFEVQTYTVTDPEGRINEGLSILDRTSLIQTIYYDISGLDLADEITLNIAYYNWGAKLEGGETREQCSVSYKVSFRITRFIGFSKSFVNTEGKLDNGVYLVPTHYTGLDKTPGMLDYFHPVYAYIVAENGHYTLVKPLSAYNSDIFGNLSGDDFFNRTTGYCRDFAYFLTDRKNTFKVADDDPDYLNYYRPGELHAKNWGALTYEFHADTGAYYYTFDLGDTLTNDIILYGGSTGAMEQMFSFPFSYRRLTISYDSMIRITDWNYTPVSGDSFTYRKSAAIYAGSVADDFSDSNAPFDLLKNYSLSVRMINMFFASTDGGNSGDKNFDCKMTIAPTTQTAAGNLSEMRYAFSYFDLTYDVFGYNPKTDGYLYSAATNFLTLIDVSATNFTIEKTDIGKTVKTGETVDLVSLYTEKVYPTVTAANLSWQAYSLDKSGDVDYDKPMTLSRSFIMGNSGVAILFTEKADDKTRTCLVTLMPSEEPEYKILSDDWTYNETEGVYITNARYKIDKYVSVPEITWTWLGDKYTSRSLRKYEDSEPRTDFLRVAVYEYTDGIYSHIYDQFSDGYEAINVFRMTEPKMRVEFRLVNRFGEFRSVWLEYRAEAVGDYAFISGDKTLAGGDLKYEKTEEGADVRRKVEYTELQSAIIDNEEQFMALPAAYYLRVTDSDITDIYELSLKSLTVYLKNSTVTVDNLAEAWELVKNERYAIVRLSYADEYGDTAMLRAMCHFTLDGRNLSEYTFIDGDAALFTGESLSIEKPKVASKDYLPLNRPAFHVYKLSGVNYIRTEDSDMTDNSGTYSAEFTFLREGTYLLVWDFWFGLDFDGNAVFDCYYNPPESISNTYTLEATFAQKVIVYDRNCDIDVTYVTDVEHPFDSSKIDYVEKDGYQYYTTTVSMAKSNSSPDYNAFVASKDRLWGWSSSWDGDDRLFSAGSAIGRLGITLKTVTPVVYALWDKGIKIRATIVVDGNEEFLNELTCYRPTTGGIYTMSLFHFRSRYEFNKYKDYEAVEWIADKAIFQVSSGSGFVYKNSLYVGSTDKAFENGYRVTEGFNLKLILKRKLNVSYQAIDENGEQLTFRSQPGADRKCLEGFTLADKISESKLNQLKNVQCTDSSKEFRYWAVMVDGKLTRIDLESTLLEQEFSGKNELTGKYNGSVVLYAVFG